MRFSLNAPTFSRAMRRLGFKGTDSVLSSVYCALDTDRTRDLGLFEVWEFICGAPHPLDPRNVPMVDLRLRPGVGGAGSLDGVVWSVRALRVLVMEMCVRTGLHPTVLARLFECGKHGISKSTFVASVRTKLFADAHPELWATEGRAVAEETFDALVKSIKGTNFLQRLHIEHLARWLTIDASLDHTDQESLESQRGLRGGLLVDASVIDSDEPRAQGDGRGDDSLADGAQAAAATRRFVTRLRDELPMRSARELRELKRQRREQAAAEARANGGAGPRVAGGPSKRVDWASKARADVLAAVAAAAEPERRDRHWLQRAHAARNGRWHGRPLLPLQRWEVPSEPFLMVTPRITLSSHLRYQEDHTTLLASRPSTRDSQAAALTTASASSPHRTGERLSSPPAASLLPRPRTTSPITSPLGNSRARGRAQLQKRLLAQLSPPLLAPVPRPATGGVDSALFYTTMSAPATPRAAQFTPPTLRRPPLISRPSGSPPAPPRQVDAPCGWSSIAPSPAISHPSPRLQYVVSRWFERGYGLVEVQQ